MLDGQDAREEGVGQHGSHSNQRGQDLLAPLVGHVVELAPFSLGGDLAADILCENRMDIW